MHTERGFARLIGFSDGVVAIAITLLILPLVTAATEQRGDLGTFFADNLFQLFVFVLSFAVIGRFWLVHHQMYESADGYNGPLLWANLLWLLSIVFLPFPTELLSSSDQDEPAVYGLYVGTMLLSTAAALLQQVIIVRTPALQAPAARGTLRLLPYVSTTVIMAVSLVAVLLLPRVGLFSLFLLFLATPIEKLIYRARKAAA